MASEPEHHPIQDPESEHPIATQWRPTLREIVRRLAGGDRRLEGIDEVDALDPRTSSHLDANIAAYGMTLIEVPEETWKTACAQWYGDHWEALVDLWTREEGRSDLALHIRVRQAGAGFRYEIEGVWVP